MAQIENAPTAAYESAAADSYSGWWGRLVQRIRTGRTGNGLPDEVPDRLRRDVGLPPRPEPDQWWMVYRR